MNKILLKARSTPKRMSLKIFLNPKRNKIAWLRRRFLSVAAVKSIYQNSQEILMTVQDLLIMITELEKGMDLMSMTLRMMIQRMTQKMKEESSLHLKSSLLPQTINQPRKLVLSLKERINQNRLKLTISKRRMTSMP